MGICVSGRRRAKSRRRSAVPFDLRTLPGYEEFRLDILAQPIQQKARKIDALALGLVRRVPSDRQGEAVHPGCAGAADGGAGPTVEEGPSQPAGEHPTIDPSGRFRPVSLSGRFRRIRPAQGSRSGDDSGPAGPIRRSGPASPALPPRRCPGRAGGWWSGESPAG